MTSTRPEDDRVLTEALEALTLEEKVQLLTGRDFWNTWPMEKIGLRNMLVSDGPSGGGLMPAAALAGALAVAALAALGLRRAGNRRPVANPQTP